MGGSKGEEWRGGCVVHLFYLLNREPLKAFTQGSDVSIKILFVCLFGAFFAIKWT